MKMSNQELVWGQPGLCPSCEVVTEHTWFGNLTSHSFDQELGRSVERVVKGSQGILRVSQCTSRYCQALTVWIRDAQDTRLIFPQTGVRTPPAEGLNEEEVKLYEEAAALALASPRAACALLRVLLEAFLKRHLSEVKHSVDSTHLVGIIKMAVQHLELSQTLKKGLTAIRKRGNTAVHDPYGLTDAARAADLPWLFQAVDDLVDDLHVKPQKWAGMAGT